MVTYKYVECVCIFMVEDKNPDDTTHKRLSYRNITDLENLGKAEYGETFNNVVSKVVTELKELKKENKKLKEEIRKLKKENEK